MKVKKALKLVDFLIEYERKMQNAMADPTKSWNVGNDNVRNLANTLSGCHKETAEILNLIRKELVGNCKHPKKMRDKDANGNWYCMSCNLDL